MEYPLIFFSGALLRAAGRVLLQGSQQGTENNNTNIIKKRRGEKKWAAAEGRVPKGTRSLLVLLPKSPPLVPSHYRS